MIAFSTRVSYAFSCFFAILSKGEIPQDIARDLIASPSTTSASSPARIAADKAPDDSVDRAVQMLALFQRDGRLVDFLIEDVSPYPDGQLGAAVRRSARECTTGYGSGGNQARRIRCGRTASQGSVASQRLESDRSQPALVAPGIRAQDCRTRRGRDRLTPLPFALRINGDFFGFGIHRWY